MWTPKRILILSGCFVAFFTCYLGYAFSSVGRIDGLPPLPESFWPNPSDSKFVLPARPPSTLEKRLKLAFGPNCEERKWAIRLDLQKKNMVLAAQQFQLTNDGRVSLSPLSVALFGKEKAGLHPEINTVHGEIAFIKFDRPVFTFADIGNRKIVEAELAGRIRITSNRRRPLRDEDLLVQIHAGPLYFSDLTREVWTTDVVKVTDHKSKPDPHVVIGKGMKMKLRGDPQAQGQSKNKKPAKDAKDAKEQEPGNGVEWVMLQSSVNMLLQLDGKSGQFAPAGPTPSAGAKADPKAKPKPPERATLRITTPGSFKYTLQSDHDLAHFDIGALDQQRGQPRLTQPLHVHVVRTNLVNNLHDQLVCHQLTLRLRKREGSDKQNPATQTRPGESPQQAEAIEIETIHAQAPGQNVVIASDQEKLHAWCGDFFHDAKRKRTHLRGTAGVVVKRENSDMLAHEVEIEDVPQTGVPGKPPPKAAQKIQAKGPGEIHFAEKNEKTKENRVLFARWEKMLTSARDGDQDVLTLTGSAEFDDKVSKQWIKGDILKAWLVSASQTAVPKGGSVGGRMPKVVEANSRVSAFASDFRIIDTHRLIARFNDVPSEGKLPGRVTDTPALGQVVSGNAGGAGRPEQPVGVAPLPPGQSPTPGQPAPQKHPFELRADLVEVDINRLRPENPVDILVCEGTVRVRQQAEKEGERDTRVKGDKLKATHLGDRAYHLVVTGDLAELEGNAYQISGPEVNVDQKSNEAWVVGDGGMLMESKTNLQNEPLSRPVPIEVFWKKSMVFNGETAEFHGEVNAIQKDEKSATAMTCELLTVQFDRPVSMRRPEGNKRGGTEQKPSIKKMVFDQNVRIEQTRFEKDGRQGKVLGYKRLNAPAVTTLALESEDVPDPIVQVPGAKGKQPARSRDEITASGPGAILDFGPGGDVLVAGPEKKAKAPAKAAAPEAKTQLTYISFGRRMNANNQSNIATFWENVQVLRMPSERHDVMIDLTAILVRDLPEGAIYVSCDQLKTLSRKEKDKAYKEMEARGNVYLQAPEFFARSEKASINEIKKQIILEGTATNSAQLTKVTRRGDQGQVVRARKIMYFQDTGRVIIEEAETVTGNTGK